MTPERMIIIGDHKIAQYYWAGKWPVYVNNRLVEQSYDEAVAAAQAQLNEQF